MHLDPSTKERLSEFIFEMGNGLFKTKQFEIAVRWLERSHDILESQELENLSMDGGDLRYRVICCLGRRSDPLNHANLTISAVRALLGMKGDTAQEKALDLLNLLETVREWNAIKGRLCH
jgi:hypothetical protein